MEINYKRLKWACYTSNVTMSVVACFSAVLFMTFHKLYGISYSLLGLLVLINFFTQLIVDIIFTFLSKHFNVHKTIRIMPLITATGLCVYALMPLIFPQFAFAGLVIGTIIFSLAAGLNEVLSSPMVAALPSDTPDKDMSVLHSLYGYGLVGVVIISTLFGRAGT